MQRLVDKRFALALGGEGTEHEVKDKTRAGKRGERSRYCVVYVVPGRLFVSVHVGVDEEFLDGRIVHARLDVADVDLDSTGGVYCERLKRGGVGKVEIAKGGWG